MSWPPMSKIHFVVLDVHAENLDGQPSIADILRSRRQERLAREATEEAAAKAAAMRVDRQPLELESASEEKQEG